MHLLFFVTHNAITAHTLSSKLVEECICIDFVCQKAWGYSPTWIICSEKVFTGASQATPRNLYLFLLKRERAYFCMTDHKLLYNYVHWGPGFQTTTLFVNINLLIVYSAVPLFSISVVNGDQVNERNHLRGLGPWEGILFIWRKLLLLLFFFFKVIHVQYEAHKTNKRQWKFLRDVTIN